MNALSKSPINIEPMSLTLDIFSPTSTIEYYSINHHSDSIVVGVLDG